MPYLKTGHASRVSFSLNTGLLVKAKQVTPLGITGDTPVDLTTLENVEWETQWHQDLKKCSAIKVTAAYDAAALAQLDDMALQNQQATCYFAASGVTATVWGWINEAKPSPLEKGKQPEMEITFEISNLDNSDNEAGPVFA